MGHQRQFLPAGIAPLHKTMRIVGRAMPVLEADVVNDGARSAGPLSGKPFGLMLEALDDLQPGEIYIATGASLRYALWGGLMSTRAQHLKAAGAILDGYVRDADEIERLGFDVFCRGTYAQDQGVRGQVIDWRCTIEIEGVRIAPGDLLVGDAGCGHRARSRPRRCEGARRCAPRQGGRAIRGGERVQGHIPRSQAGTDSRVGGTTPGEVAARARASRRVSVARRQGFAVRRLRAPFAPQGGGTARSRQAWGSHPVPA